MILDDEKELNNEQEEVNTPEEETVAQDSVEIADEPVQEITAAAAEEEEEEVVLPVFDAVQTGGAHDDFNWSIDKRGTIAYSADERVRMLKEYDATLSNVVENEIITGRVSAISGGDVVLDINYKSDGLIPLNEFRDMPGIATGDQIEVYVESQEDSQGQLGLSRRKAKILRAWKVSLTLSKMALSSAVLSSAKPRAVLSLTATVSKRSFRVHRLTSNRWLTTIST
jgi:small subunit ribosomal protein S1